MSETPRTDALLEELAAIMKTEGITQERMAKELDVPQQQQISRWIRRSAEPLAETALKIQEWNRLRLSSILRKPEKRRAYEANMREIRGNA